jgi:hypothetical protein
MVWTLSFKDPLLGLANVKWGGGISIIWNNSWRWKISTPDTISRSITSTLVWFPSWSQNISLHHCNLPNRIGMGKNCYETPSQEPILSLLQRDESWRVGSSNTGPTVLHRLVWDRELSQVVSNHLRLPDKMQTDILLVWQAQESLFI